MKARIYYLDHLRTFLILLVVILHSGLVYEAVLESSWIVVDPVKADWIGLIRMYLDIFVMFSLFFISGYFIEPSYRKKAGWEFVKAKFTRIMLPWIFAVLTLIPLYKYIFLLSRGMPQEPWYTYFHFFNRPGGNPYYFADNPVMNWLWFLPILFTFQIAYFAIRKAGVNFKEISVKTTIIAIMVLGLAYSMTTTGLGLKGWFHSTFFHFQWERLFVYFLVFLLGVVIYEHRALEELTTHKKQYILVNIVLSVSLTIFTATALNLFFNLIDPGRDYYFITPGADRTFYYSSLLISMLSFIYILLYSFKAYVNKTNTLLNELSKNSYYVYLIHVVVLGTLALPLLSLSIPSGIKFIILSLGTWVVSNIIVYGYNKLIHRYVSGSMASLLLIIIFLSVITLVYRQQNLLTPSENKGDNARIENLVGIHEAAATGNIDAIDLHIELATDLNLKEPTGGSSPLITACLFGQTEAALRIINAGADLDFQNNDGSTALHTAAFFGRVKIVEALLESDIDKNIKNKDGATALDIVSGDFESLKPIYDYFNNTFNLNLSDEALKKSRLQIKEILELDE